MDILAKIAEQRIREAMERGEFDNLPFHGKPIKLDDLVGVPEHLRMHNHVPLRLTASSISHWAFVYSTRGVIVPSIPALLQA